MSIRTGRRPQPLARRRIRLSHYPTSRDIAPAAGDKLAVDAVLIIGEHGEYRKNEFGAKKNIRATGFFKQVVDVFRKDGRATPVFNDKHLFVEIRLGQGDGRCVEGVEVRVLRRVIAPRHVAHAVDRHAVRGPKMKK